jgi:signal transduction histidine kinase
MVIVATIALSTMVCNDLVMPVLVRIRALRSEDLSRVLISIRRGSIIGVLLLGYLFFRFTGESYALVTIGLMSFAAAAQFAPPILIGIYWKGASKKGAIVGLMGGFLMWAYTLLLPSFAKSGWLPTSFISEGPFDIKLLAPYTLFGLDMFDILTHSVFWSMLVNVGFLVSISLFDRQGAFEKLQAKLFVDVFSKGIEPRDTRLWSGTSTVAEIKDLVTRLIGPIRSERAFAEYEKNRGVKLEINALSDANLVEFAERELSGAIGAASARVMVSSVVQGEALSMEGVMKILDEASQIIEYSHKLEQKSLELEAASKKLREANERLKELDRMKDEFVSIVSHELRTPLTAIRALSEILHDNPELDREERQRFLGNVVKESERLSRLINQVLDMAKIEAETAEWVREQVDLRELVEEGLVTTNQLFVERSVVLDRELPSKPILVTVDRDRLVQVVINLLSNAVKFCEKDAGIVKIRMKTGDNAVRVEVSDNGPGIPLVEQEKIFNKFHQIKDRTKGKPMGSGLGLSISQRIIEYHGGKIWVESTRKQGATFIFTLPKSDSRNRT